MVVSSRVHGDRTVPQPLEPQPIYILSGVYILLDVVNHDFNPSTWELEVVDHCEVKASLVYIVGSRTA